MNADRRTTETLLGHRTPLDREGRGYRLFPTNPIAAGAIARGYDAWVRHLPLHRPALVDGVAGVDWDSIRGSLDAAFRRIGVRPYWLPTARAAIRPDQLEHLAEGVLFAGDPLFGRRFEGSLDAFFDAASLERLRCDVTGAPADELPIVYGPGAALVGNGFLVFADLPKNELQYRARSGAPTNLGLDTAQPPKEAYRRSYYLDWPALTRHRSAFAEQIDLFVDAQDVAEPSVAAGDTVRSALKRLAGDAFRVRPWFESGAWGGQWLRRHVAGVAADAPNYAWSFEMITPENGLVLSDGDDVLEVPFDLLMTLHAGAILGPRGTRFGTYFPIRINLLDTIAGGNLSVQCHPDDEWARREFGEPIGQHETYYIAECEPGARTYCGLREGVDIANFRAALERSASESDPVDIDRYVRSWPTRKGELYVIPSGTIHCAGRDNLVLEISSTPYLYTFKMYDWLRNDLDGSPRPLNIERAFAVLEPRQASPARAAETVIAAGDGWQHVLLATDPRHPHQVERLSFDRDAAITTTDSVLLGNLVEGDDVEVVTANGATRFNRLETFCIPAAVNTVQFRNQGAGAAVLVLARLKPERGP